eukprot:scaffold20029_cov63-Phaeocystis_antarctica.AAC.1
MYSLGLGIKYKLSRAARGEEGDDIRELCEERASARVRTCNACPGRSPCELEALLEGQHRRGACKVGEARGGGVEDLGELERLDGGHLLARLPLVLGLHARRHDHRDRADDAHGARVGDACVLGGAKGAIEGGVEGALRHLGLDDLAAARHREHIRVGGLPSRLVLAQRRGAGLRGGAPLGVEGAVGDHGASVRLGSERDAITPLICEHDAAVALGLEEAGLVLERRLGRQQPPHRLQLLRWRGVLAERRLHVDDTAPHAPSPAECGGEGDVGRSVARDQRSRLAHLLHATAKLDGGARGLRRVRCVVHEKGDGRQEQPRDSAAGERSHERRGGGGGAVTAANGDARAGAQRSRGGSANGPSPRARR